MSDVFGSVPGAGPVIDNPVDGDGPQEPSKAGYWFGALLIVVGVVGAIVWVAARFVALDEAIDDFERVPVGQVGTIDLDEGDYVVYAERGSGLAQSLAVGEVRMRPAGEADSRVDMAPYETDFTYDFGGNRVGRAVWTFEIEDGGEYEVIAEDVGSATTAAFGRSIAGDLATLAVGALAIGAVGVIAGVVLLVVTSSRRRKWRRRNWLDAAGPPPGTWNPAPAGATWGGQPAPGTWSPPPATPPAPGTWNPAPGTPPAPGPYPPPPPGSGYPPPPPPG